MGPAAMALQEIEPVPADETVAVVENHAAELPGIAALMAGSYSSAEQAAADAEYFDVRLQMVPLWSEREGEHWLYVEQAMATALDKPYRQRIYRLVATADGPVSIVYTLPGDALQYAGAWQKPELLAELTPEQLVEKEGCGIVLRKNEDGSWAGSTVEKNCPSDLNGASYATSEVTIAADFLTSWDRGFAADDEQVWGAKKGPYQFRKTPAEGGGTKDKTPPKTQ